jgi:hypothetical protein
MPERRGIRSRSAEGLSRENGWQRKRRLRSGQRSATTKVCRQSERIAADASARLTAPEHDRARRERPGRPWLSIAPRGSNVLSRQRVDPMKYPEIRTSSSATRHVPGHLPDEHTESRRNAMQCDAYELLKPQHRGLSPSKLPHIVVRSSSSVASMPPASEAQFSGSSIRRDPADPRTTWPRFIQRELGS